MGFQARDDSLHTTPLVYKTLPFHLLGELPEHTHRLVSPQTKPAQHQRPSYDRGCSPNHHIQLSAHNHHRHRTDLHKHFCGLRMALQHTQAHLNGSSSDHARDKGVTLTE